MIDFRKVIDVISKALNSKESIEVQGFIYDLQDRITRLTEKCSDLEKTVVNLNAQMAEYDSWEKEKAKYEIAQDSRLNTVYRLKGGTQIVCPVCFNKNKVVIHLQPRRLTPGKFLCPACKNEFVFQSENE